MLINLSSKTTQECKSTPNGWYKNKNNTQVYQPLINLKLIKGLRCGDWTLNQHGSGSCTISSLQQWQQVKQPFRASQSNQTKWTAVLSLAYESSANTETIQDPPTPCKNNNKLYTTLSSPWVQHQTDRMMRILKQSEINHENRYGY